MATAATQKLSGRPLLTLLEEAAKAYGKQLSRLEAQAYLQSWSALERRVGRARFEAALTCAIAESKFFPKIADLECRVQQVKLVGRADEHCPVCGGSGWEYLYAGFTCGSEDGERNPVDPKIGAVRRCSCWQKTEVA